MKPNNVHVTDILNCLANLSSDEVFTSPELANKMLDLLPQELFSSSKTTFLDPCCKSGVFLREIAKRLLKGLEKEIPDLQKRIDHIMSKQLFGIALTRLTAEMGRRTLYCAKKADGEYSVATCFNDEQGHLRYMRCEHKWENGKCKKCGANQVQYDRNETGENYAYPFIHKSINEIFNKNMQFDVIIGNPPYQMDDGGGTGDSAKPLYHLFVEQAKLLKPKYLIMITPSRWMKGGKGLDDYRQIMRSDTRIRYIFDYEDASKCFQGLHIDGGVSYFLWDSSYNGPVDYCYQSLDGETHRSSRYLKVDYSDLIVRDPRQISIIRKVSKQRVDSFSKIVSTRKPYGIATDLFNAPENYPQSQLSESPFPNSVKIFGVKGNKGGAKRVVGFVSIKFPSQAIDEIRKFKIFFSYAYTTTATVPPQPILAKPNEIATETFLRIGPFEKEYEASNCLSYIKTKFFRALLFFNRGQKNASTRTFELIPLQDFSHPWTDEMLYKKYNLDKDEIAFIESMIKPME